MLYNFLMEHESSIDLADIKDRLIKRDLADMKEGIQAPQRG